jgi:hypothetical protein
MASAYECERPASSLPSTMHDLINSGLDLSCLSVSILRGSADRLYTTSEGGITRDVPSSVTRTARSDGLSVLTGRSFFRAGAKPLIGVRTEGVAPAATDFC